MSSPHLAIATHWQVFWSSDWPRWHVVVGHVHEQSGNDLWAVLGAGQDVGHCACTQHCGLGACTKPDGHSLGHAQSHVVVLNTVGEVHESLCLQMHSWQLSGFAMKFVPLFAHVRSVSGEQMQRLQSVEHILLSRHPVSPPGGSQISPSLDWTVLSPHRSHAHVSGFCDVPD